MGNEKLNVNVNKRFIETYEVVKQELSKKELPIYDEEMCDKIGTSRSALGRIKRNAKAVPLEVLSNLKKVSPNVNFDYILLGKGGVFLKDSDKEVKNQLATLNEKVDNLSGTLNESIDMLSNVLRNIKITFD